MLQRTNLWKKESVHVANLFFFFILEICHSHHNLQQPLTWSASRHQHQGNSFHQWKDYNSLKAQIIASLFFLFHHSVTKSCLTLCNPMDCSMPGFPVLHYLLEFAAITNSVLEGSVNITFIYTGKPQNWCGLLYLQYSLYCKWLSGIKPTMSPGYAWLNSMHTYIYWVVYRLA